MAWAYRLVGYGFLITWWVFEPVGSLSPYESFAVKLIVAVVFSMAATVIDIENRLKGEGE